MKKPAKESRTAKSSPKPTPKRPPSSRPVELTDGMRDRIARKAYELYEQQGRQEGRDVEYWLEAEAIIIDELGRSGNQSR